MLGGTYGRLTGGKMLGGALLGQNAAAPGTPPEEPFECPVTLDPIVTSADYVYVKDITNGCVLYAKDEDTQMDPASTTKLATAILVSRWKGENLSDTVTVTSADVADLATISTMGLQANDVITIEDLFYGAMLVSGADATKCLGRIIGTQIYVAGGSTGNTGLTRFHEAMNDLATELGCTGTAFTNTYGINDAGHYSTAKDMGLIAEEAFSDPLVVTISGTSNKTATITGANARTIDLTNTHELVTGGFNGVLAGKTGTLLPSTCNLTTLWESADEVRVAIGIFHATTTAQRYDDTKSLISQLPRDYVYLGNDPAPSDPSFASVIFLAGFDGSIADESSVGRTLTANGDAQATATNRLIGSHSLLLDGTGDYLESPDAADLSMGSGDFTIEFFYGGISSEPGAHINFIGKWNAGAANQREWRVGYDSAGNYFFSQVSFDGTVASGSVFKEARCTVTPANVFDGARHHIAVVRNGTELAIYVDGVKGGTTGAVSTTALFAGTAPMNIGCALSAGSPIQLVTGTMDEVRITKGVARYTANFTPPFAKFPRV